MGTMSENSPKGCNGETQNGRESDCRNQRRRSNNNTDTVDADSDPQDNIQEAVRGAQGVRCYKGAVLTVERVYLL